MSPKKITLTLLISFFFFFSASSQVAKNQYDNSVFDWFYDQEEVLEVEIQTDLETFVDQKMTNDKLKGVFTITNSADEVRSLPMSLRARGRFRRRLCDFPPVKIDFVKGGLTENGFNKFDEYKLVTHCFDNGIGKVYVFKEYLTYRLYQELTDNSFRVQLLKIKYLNKKGKRKATAYGFMIEDEKELAARLQSDLVKDYYNISHDSLILSEIHRHDVFQYMVCNTDWNLPMFRNMKLLWNTEKQRYFVVPYDFDFSGLVKAHYAVPNADLGQTNIRERHYMGITRSEEELKETLALFQSKRDAMLRHIKQFKKLSADDRHDMITFINSFYDSLEDGSFKVLLEGMKK